VVVGLDKLDLSFRRGEFVAITGESGSGKSTLSHVLGGILPYESGELYCGGKPTSHYDSVDWEHHRRDRVSFISQSYGILAGATVLANVVTALRITGMDPEEALAAAEDILRQVSLWELRSRRAAKLSSVPLVVPPHALGDSTETAVQSGIVIGAATQIEGLVERIQRELAAEGDNVPRATVVGTGGYSETIAEATDLFDALDPDITIRGIYQIWRHAVEKHASRVED
jgi:ABC-type oligopeptide transport system ATPase subunit